MIKQGVYFHFPCGDRPPRPGQYIPIFHPHPKTPSEQGGDVFPLAASMVILGLIGGLAFSCAWK